MGIVTSRALQGARGEAQVLIGKVGGVARMTADTGRCGWRQQKVAIGSEVRTVAFETAIRLGSRSMRCLAHQPVLDLRMAGSTKWANRRYEEARGRAGVGLVAASAPLDGWWVGGAARRRCCRHVMTGGTDFRCRCREQPLVFRGMWLVTGVAFAGFERRVLRQHLRCLEHAVMTLTAQGLSLGDE